MDAVMQIYLADDANTVVFCISFIADCEERYSLLGIS
jgi:hypothetical protein